MLGIQEPVEGFRHDCRGDTEQTFPAFLQPHIAQGLRLLRASLPIGRKFASIYLFEVDAALDLDFEEAIAAGKILLPDFEMYKRFEHG